MTESPGLLPLLELSPGQSLHLYQNLGYHQVKTEEGDITYNIKIRKISWIIVELDLANFL